MEQLKARVAAVINDHLPGAEVDLEFIPESEKLSGHVISGEFLGLSQRERQRILWDVLRARLTLPEQGALSAILTFTPAEMHALAAAA